MAESEAVNQTDIQKHLRVSAGTVSNWVSDITQKKQRKRDGRIWWLHQLGWTQEEIGERVGIVHSAVNKILSLSSNLKKVTLDQSSRGHSPEQIAQAEDVSPELVGVDAKTVSNVCGESSNLNFFHVTGGNRRRGEVREYTSKR